MSGWDLIPAGDLMQLLTPECIEDFSGRILHALPFAVHTKLCTCARPRSLAGTTANALFVATAETQAQRYAISKWSYDGDDGEEPELLFKRDAPEKELRKVQVANTSINIHLFNTPFRECRIADAVASRKGMVHFCYQVVDDESAVLGWAAAGGQQYGCRILSLQQVTPQELAS